jgi:tetratricopeptide (TPR) repeat protein
VLSISYEQAIFIARQHLDGGRTSQAEDLCRRVLRDQPKRAEALHLLGLAASKAARHEQAIALLRRATAVDSEFVQAFTDLGNALLEAGQDDDAIAAYREAARLDPQRGYAHAGIGDVLRHKGDMPGAIAAYQAALQVQPNIAEIHNDLGIALAADGKPDDAIASYLRAIELKPDLANAHYNLANAYRGQDNLDEAIAAYGRAIRIRPNFPEAHSNLGDALKASGQVSVAIAAYKEAIRLSPLRPEPHWNRALAFLTQGDFERGWAEYEWRHRRPGSHERPGTAWNGESLAGKTILLHAEQGLGDTIQFVRYLPMVAALGGRIVLECQPELCRLLGGSANPSAVMPSGQPPPAFDVHCPLLSLPRIFETRLESIPSEVPYLKPAAALLEKWGGIVGPKNGLRRVGLVWAGRGDHQYDRNRSMTLGDFAPLARIGGVEFYSLQKGAPEGQALDPPAGMVLKDHSAMFSDLAETAALIAHMDLVIAVDTAVAHLAGAMGRPVWVMLAFAPDWRWMLDRPDSPWYPSMRLFRQESIGDWGDVLQEVGQHLSLFAGEGPTGLGGE